MEPAQEDKSDTEEDNRESHAAPDKNAEEKEDERFWKDLEAYEETSSNEDDSDLGENDQTQHSLTSNAEPTPMGPAESQFFQKTSNQRSGE